MVPSIHCWARPDADRVGMLLDQMFSCSQREQLLMYIFLHRVLQQLHLGYLQPADNVAFITESDVEFSHQDSARSQMSSQTLGHPDRVASITSSRCSCGRCVCGSRTRVRVNQRRSVGTSWQKGGKSSVSWAMQDLGYDKDLSMHETAIAGQSPRTEDDDFKFNDTELGFEDDGATMPVFAHIP